MEIHEYRMWNKILDKRESNVRLVESDFRWPVPLVGSAMGTTHSFQQVAIRAHDLITSEILLKNIFFQKRAPDESQSVYH